MRRRQQQSHVGDPSQVRDGTPLPPAEFREVIVLRDLEEFSYKNRRRDQHSFGHGHVAPGARPRAAQAHSVRSAEGETVNGL